MPPHFSRNAILLAGLCAVIGFHATALGYTKTVGSVISPDTLLMGQKDTIRLVGIVPPADPTARSRLTKMLAKRLTNKRVEIEPDKDLMRKEDLRTRGKSVRYLVVPAYLFFACDTCGVSEDTPEFTGMEMVTTHTNILLNRMLIEQGHCSVNTQEDYERKDLFRYLEYLRQQKNPLE